MQNFEIELSGLLNRLGKAKLTVLATSKNDRMTARTMSCVIIDGAVYFQTDKSFVKYEQITANPNVALCVDNISIEGTAAVIGHPLADSNKAFAAAYEENYKGSFDSYSHITSEVVIKVKPQRINTWEYEDGKPFRMFFDFAKQTCLKEYV